MKTMNAVVLTVQEAREEIADWISNWILTNSVETRAMIRTGVICRIPNLVQMDHSMISELYAEMCLGEQHLKTDPKHSLVLVAYSYEEYTFAAGREQMGRKPEQRELTLDEVSTMAAEIKRRAAK